MLRVEVAGQRGDGDGAGGRIRIKLVTIWTDVEPMFGAVFNT